MRKGNYRFRRPRCCGSMMVSAYIRHGSAAPGIEKIGLYCTRCRRFEIERPMQPAFDEFVRRYPVLKHVATALKPYMDTVRGLYFHGSRTRGDYRDNSDYDLLLITRDKIDDALKTELTKHNIQVECFSLKQVKKQLELEPSYLLNVLQEGVPLIGAELREQLLKKKVNDIALHVELDDCKKQLKVLKKMLKYELDGEDKTRILHSAVMRLRRAYYIKRFYDKNIPPLDEDFKRYYTGDFNKFYELYRVARDLVHNDRLNEAGIPEEIKKMTKLSLKGLVSSVDAYVKDAYQSISELLVEKQGLDK